VVKGNILGEVIARAKAQRSEKMEIFRKKLDIWPCELLG
jgi:hypothetical protein